MFAFDKPLTWIIILLIVLLIFGAGKLPDIGKSLGRSIKEFKDETKSGMSDDAKSTTTATPAATVESKPTMAATNGSAAPTVEPTVRRRIIKHPDGREEVIEEQVIQK